ncbi:GGDEF domain-containing protein [Peptococcaceae bacterium 1198_IL3148]
MFLLITRRLIKAKENLEVAAYTDALTGTFNRRYFHKYIQQLSAPNLIMMMVDINNLKQINDKFGHHCGDKVIKVVADTLKRYSENKGFTIRWGGDEFLVILCNKNKQKFQNLTDQIKADISQYCIIANKAQIPITVSIGIAEQLKGETFIDTVNRVDKKMYQEKNIIHRRSGPRYTSGL